MSPLLTALLAALALTGWFSLGVIAADILRGVSPRWIGRGTVIRGVFIWLSVVASVVLTLLRWSDLATLALIVLIVGGIAGFALPANASPS